MKGPNLLDKENRLVRLGGPFILAAPGLTFTIPVILDKAKDILSLKLIGLPPSDQIEAFDWVLGPSATPDWNLEKLVHQIGRFDLDLWSPTPFCEGTCWVLNFTGRLSTQMEKGDRIQFPITGFANEAHIPLTFEPVQIEVI
jgi:hypothetical protein